MTYTTIHITRLIILLTILLCFFFLSSPLSVHAYRTSGQSATALKNHTALFQINYDFGTKKHALRMPVRALPTLEKINDVVSYSILDESDTVAQGKTTGMIFSGAPLTKYGTYITQKGVAWQFSLMVFFTPDTYIPGKQYRLQVNQLPFNFDGKQQLQLNPSELTYYTTKLISL